MFSLCVACISRIVSNSYLNILQKILTLNGEKSSVVNFYSYLGLSFIGLVLTYNNLQFCKEAFIYICLMGLLGALGNYFIIKALSIGEVSSLAPINSYKPIVALIFGMFFLKEYPTLYELFGIFLIILGTFMLTFNNYIHKKSLYFRFLALLFSGSEAILIKKVILLTDISSTFFYWAISGLIFSFIFINKNIIILSANNIKYQLSLIILIAIMQYSTNYAFLKMNTAHALAIFQLSTILSVCLGVNIFKEKDFFKKIVASLIMIFGAIILILR